MRPWPSSMYFTAPISTQPMNVFSDMLQYAAASFALRRVIMREAPSLDACQPAPLGRGHSGDDLAQYDPVGVDERVAPDRPLEGLAVGEEVAPAEVTLAVVENEHAEPEIAADRNLLEASHQLWVLHHLDERAAKGVMAGHATHITFGQPKSSRVRRDHRNVTRKHDIERNSPHITTIAVKQCPDQEVSGPTRCHIEPVAGTGFASQECRVIVAPIKTPVSGRPRQLALIVDQLPRALAHVPKDLDVAADRLIAEEGRVFDKVRHLHDNSPFRFPDQL